MDPNSLQRLPGTAYINKLEPAAQAQTPFAQFDTLTPDEPIWVWKVVKRLLNFPNTILNSHVVQTPSNTFSTQFQQGDG